MAKRDNKGPKIHALSADNLPRQVTNRRGEVVTDRHGQPLLDREGVPSFGDGNLIDFSVVGTESRILAVLRDCMRRGIVPLKQDVASRVGIDPGNLSRWFRISKDIRAAWTVVVDARASDYVRVDEDPSQHACPMCGSLLARKLDD